jgi:hypothetical protein
MCHMGSIEKDHTFSFETVMGLASAEPPSTRKSDRDLIKECIENWIKDSRFGSRLDVIP